MYLSVIFTTLLSTIAFTQSVAPKNEICGTFLNKQAIVNAEAVFSAAPEITFEEKPQSKTIKVYWNAIYTDETLEGGYIPRKQIEAQIDVLNEGFCKTPYHFELAGVKRAKNATWFAAAGPYSDRGLAIALQMKTKLRRGDNSTLNMFSVGFKGENKGLLGYATFPSDLEKNPLEDGVVLLYSTLPGGTREPFNLGGVGIHEVGHWVGLYHTFQGDSCEGPGDYVKDTPAELTPASGCPVDLDTCPDDPGLDPIHNYMDYSDDACYTEFTRGQIKRMRKQMKYYRHV